MNDSRQDYRLHHVPFFLIWVALFGVAWLSTFVGGMLFASIRNNIPLLRDISYWVHQNALWIDGLLLGAFIGAFLALVQPWLIRWRYGFSPRYWRIATFFGTLLSSGLFSQIMYSGGYYDLGISSVGTAFLLWFSALGSIQMLALWPVARRAWLYPLAGFGAFAVGMGMSLLEDNFAAYGSDPFTILFYGTIAQAVLSGLFFLWLMRDYRVEAVPKRDEKAKIRHGIGLHPVSFIGLWAMVYLGAWVMLFGMAFVVYTLGTYSSLIRDFFNWLFSNRWIAAGLLGFFMGAVTAFPQHWLMKQRSNYSPGFRRWMLLSVAGWIIAGQALPELSSSSSFNGRGPLFLGAMLLLWFALPTVFQAAAFWGEKRGGWLYALAGIVSAVMAFFVNEQLLWTNMGGVYAMLFGAGLQAILTGTAFLTIMAQNQQAQEASLEAAPVEAAPAIES